MAKNRLSLILLIILAVFFILALLFTADYETYLLETSPVYFGVAFLILTRKKIIFSNLSYLFLWLGAVMVIIGGFYTYAAVPFFSWLQEALGLTRNYYDRFGHIFQGLISAIVAVDLLSNNITFKNKKIFFFIILCLVLAVSAGWELMEMIICYLFQDKTQVFMAIQADFWDAQWDMICAIIGFILYMVFFAQININKKNELS